MTNKQLEDEIIDAIYDGVAQSLTHDLQQIVPDDRIIVVKDIFGDRQFELVSQINQNKDIYDKFYTVKREDMESSTEVRQREV